MEVHSINIAGGQLGCYNPVDGVIYDSKTSINIETLNINQFHPETELYLELSESCNMNCACAVGVDQMKASGHVPEQMSRQTLEIILRGLFDAQEKLRSQNPEKDSIKIKYAGGEPLFPKNLELIGQAQSILDELGKEHPNIKFRQIILTNGLLLNDKVVELIKKNDIHVSVSLWGLGDDNDKERGMRKGFNSSDRVLNGIKRMVEAGVTFNVNHVVSPSNAHKLALFVEKMWNINSPNFVGKDWNFVDGKKPLAVAIQFLRPQTSEHLQTLLQGGTGAMIDGVNKMFEVAIKLLKDGIYVPGLRKVDYLQPFDGVTGFTCGSGINYVAAGPRGVANCHEGLYGMDPNLSQLENGMNPLELANNTYKDIASIASVSRDYSAIDTSMHLPLALHGGGGCPRVENLSSESGFGITSNTFTKIVYAGIFDKYLEFEATRRIIFNSNKI